MNKLKCVCCNQELECIGENNYYCKNCNVTVEIQPDTVDDFKDSKLIITQGKKEVIDLDVDFSPDKKTLLRFNPRKKVSEYQVPHGVEIIEENAFSMWRDLETIVFPSTVKKIGMKCFWLCSNLTSITLNEGLEEIGEGAFYGCEKLKVITLPSTVKKLEEDCFFDCGNLSDITLNEGLKEIGDFAFSWCKNLKSITLPTTLKYLGKRIFGNLKNIEVFLRKNFVIPNTWDKEWDSWDYSGNKKVNVIRKN